MSLSNSNHLDSSFICKVLTARFVYIPKKRSREKVRSSFGAITCAVRSYVQAEHRDSGSQGSYSGHVQRHDPANIKQKPDDTQVSTNPGHLHKVSALLKNYIAPSVRVL